MEEHITDLQVRFAYQERMVEELSETVYRQQMAIERLEQELLGLKKQMSAVAPSLTKKPEEEEPPPHY